VAFRDNNFLELFLDMVIALPVHNGFRAQAVCVLLVADQLCRAVPSASFPFPPLSPVSDPLLPCLRLLDEADAMGVELELVSSSVDKTLIVWRTTKSALGVRPLRFVPSAPLKGHEAGISGIAVHLNHSTGTLLLASTSIDGTVIVWKRSAPAPGSSFSVLQVFKFGSKLVESLAFSQIPGSSACFLVCGAVDNLVHVFASDDAVSKFSKLTSLSGHESWVRSLAFAEFVHATTGAPYLLLASAAQDRRVRLWKFEATSAKVEHTRHRLDPAELLAQLEANEEGQLEIEQHAIVTTLPGDGARWSIQLESVILGHDDWVLSAQWMPPVRSAGKDGKRVQLPRLLTTSMDKTMVVWTPDVETGLWVEATRVGEVGGTQLGFFGGLYGIFPSESILALGFNGAFHLWHRVVPNSSHSSPSTSMSSELESSDTSIGSSLAIASSLDYSSTIEHWEPQVTISGHFGDVKDVAWDPSGNYLLSVSKDQTARIWARWTHKEEYTQKMLGGRKVPLLNAPTRYNWHELARPVIHGHDLSNVVFQAGVGHRFVLCAEEKVLRVFDAPTAFLKSMINLSQGVSISASDSKRAASANVPALGLSNKPVFERSSEPPSAAAASSSSSPIPTTQDNPAADQQQPQQKNAAEKLYEEIHPNGGYGDFDINADLEGHTPLVLAKTPPFEEQLLQRTLWPEVAKLYGHGNELVTVASSRTGDIIASACSCRVQTQEQAGIRLWDTSIWKETCEVTGPTLTVTQMQFSHSDKHMLAVSRDRGVYLLSRMEGEEASKKMRLVASIPKAHLRVVWSCSWTLDDRFVATGSRDKTVKFWRISKRAEEAAPNEEANPTSPALEEVFAAKFKDAVTSVAWAPYSLSNSNGKYVLAVAMENGSIQILQVLLASPESYTTTVLQEFHAHDVHVDSIKKMTWKLVSDNDFLLATGSSDQTVRIFSVQLKCALPS